MEDRTLRWRNRSSSFRPAGELIRTADYDVAAIATDREAKAFVERHHYSASYPAARFRFGLYRQAELVGVAVFSVPMSPAVLAGFPGGASSSVELGRFVLLDDVPANGESWFLARCFEQLTAAELVGVVSFSDPLPRRCAGGEVVFPGHIGTIYQATNARYRGRARPATLKLLADGRVFSNRAISKLRTRTRGYVYASKILERYGAAALGENEDPREWLELWLPRLTRTVRHPGNHRYEWVLPRRLRGRQAPSLPYPKTVDRLAA